MKQKKDFLNVETYQEYHERREEFRNLDIHDTDILNHLNELYPELDNDDFENGIIKEVYNKSTVK